MIFLHSSFRVSSTWLWSKFRDEDRIVAYYEVFNEELAGITRTQLISWNPDCWNSKHPPGAPYYLEFLPFLKEGGGIDNYDPRMAFELFIPSDGIAGAISETERTYLANLTERAEASGKIPLLSCKRSLGRLRVIKSAFPGFHVLLYRNLFQQWCSYAEQYLEGRTFFLDSVRRIIEVNQHDAFLRYLRRLFPLAQLSIDNSDSFCCFVLLHLYLYGQAAGAADLIIDVNRVAVDELYRGDVEREICEKTGIAIDLSDARTSLASSFAGLSNFENAADRLKTLGEGVIASAASQKGKEFVSKCLSEVIKESACYNFYAGALAAECRRLSAERDDLASERDRLRKELDTRNFAASNFAPVRALRNLFHPGAIRSARQKGG